MPNWCRNKLIVSGPDDRLDEFVKQAKGPEPRFKGSDEEPIVSPLSFPQLVPLPDDVLAAAYEYWGVKWGACEVDLKYEPGDSWAIYRFETAWSYPLEFLRRASMKFPDLVLELEYIEPNMDMFGRIDIQNGIVLAHMDWEASEREAEQRRELAAKREGELQLSLLPKPPLNFGPLDAQEIEKLREVVNKKFLDAATVVEELEQDGWICAIVDRWELHCVHREVNTRKELEERLESIGAGRLLAV